MNNMLPDSLLARLNLVAATQAELASRNRLMPRRWDYAALSGGIEPVAHLIHPIVRQRKFGSAADTILVDKGWRGTRPINELGLVERIVYRALIDCLRVVLPEHLTHRASSATFKRDPLDVEGTKYVTKTDVAAYYEFIDHDALEQELIAQTGDELATVELSSLLGKVMGRRVGIPQVHKCSDVLGDLYIDPIRRRMTRLGYVVDTYSDDFRISTPTLGMARAALEDCAREARRLGLVLNERKTYTYGLDNYRESLEAYEKAERRLFEGGKDQVALLDLDDGLYNDDDTVETATETTAGPVEDSSSEPNPMRNEMDQDDVTSEPPSMIDPVNNGVDSPQARAALRAWQLWIDEDESEEVQARSDASITQTLVARSLARLGMIGNEEPLINLSLLLRYEPSLTPETCRYLANYAGHGRDARGAVRDGIDAVVSEGSTSTWQSMWLAEVSGGIRRTKRPRPHHQWLESCVADGPSSLAATAAAALGRLGIGDPALIALALDRVSPEWRYLMLWALAKLDASFANKCADSALERKVIELATI